MEDKKTFREMLMYKWDRTIAVVGVIIIAIVTILSAPKDMVLPVVGACTTILSAFLGIKGVK